MRYTPFLLTLLLLTGCIADNKPDAHNAPQDGGRVTINVPPSPPVDKDGIADAVTTKVTADNRNVQQQLSGLINTSVDKIADTVKGIEAHINTSLSNFMQLTISMKNSIDSAITTTAELKVRLDNQIAISNKMQATLDSQVQVMNDMRLEFSNKMTAAANGQVGLLNELKQQITTMDAKAGRDVNMLPQAAVDLLVSNIHMGVITILLIVLFFSICLVLAYKYARKREADRTKEERDEKKQMFELLKEALLHVDPSKRDELQKVLHKITTSV